MKFKSIIKKTGSILAILLVIVEIFLITLILFTKISGQTPSILGYNMFVIVSPSMEPEIEVGDVIISKKYENQELCVGDVITYLGKKSDVAGKIVTHEIIEISDDTIITKGLANHDPDPAISKSDVIAVMVHKAFIIDKIYGIISTTAGFILLIVLPMVIMIISEIINLVREVKNEEGAEKHE